MIGQYQLRLQIKVTKLTCFPRKIPRPWLNGFRPRKQYLAHHKLLFLPWVSQLIKWKCTIQTILRVIQLPKVFNSNSNAKSRTTVQNFGYPNSDKYVVFITNRNSQWLQHIDEIIIWFLSLLAACQTGFSMIHLHPKMTFDHTVSLLPILI